MSATLHYVIECAGLLIGPFATAEAANKYATAKSLAEWRVRAMVSQDGAAQ